MNLKDLFYLNRSDRSVLLFFLALAVAAVAVIALSDGAETVSALSNADSAKTSHHQPFYSANARSPYYEVDTRTTELFNFDPNTADSTTLLRLGLQPWQVRNIYKYRAAGGVYRRPLDFARLYGLTRKQYLTLEPYIHISADYQSAASLYQPELRPVTDTVHHVKYKLSAGESVDLNTADTILLQRVPGIGSYFARQITNYRSRLGGFYALHQLLEIDDFPQQALPFFKVSGEVHKLNINQLTLNELKHHPYLNYYQARDIVNYRRLRGQLKSLDDLRLLHDFTPTDMERLSHYVAF